MVQIRGAKKGLSIHARLLHLPSRRCCCARRSSAELASSTPGTRRQGEALDSPLQLCPSLFRTALCPTALGGGREREPLSKAY